MLPKSLRSVPRRQCLPTANGGSERGRQPHRHSCQGVSKASVVHTSAGGTKVRIKISNTFGDHPLLIGGAHIARRTAAADIDPTSDRTLMFHGRSSTTVPARSMVASDPAELRSHSSYGKTKNRQPVELAQW